MDDFSSQSIKVVENYLKTKSPNMKFKCIIYKKQFIIILLQFKLIKNYLRLTLG